MLAGGVSQARTFAQPEQVGDHTAPEPPDTLDDEPKDNHSSGSFFHSEGFQGRRKSGQLVVTVDSQRSRRIVFQLVLLFGIKDFGRVGPQMVVAV